MGIYVDVNLGSFVKRSKHQGIFECKLQIKIFLNIRTSVNEDKEICIEGKFVIECGGRGM